MASLQNLSLNYAGIEDLDFIKPLKGLRSVSLKNNAFTSVSALTGLSGLETVDVSGNSGITDLGSLKNCASLNILTCSNISYEQEQELLASNITVVKN